MTSQSPSTFFFCYSWFYKALSYFCPAESFPGMRAPGTQLLHVCQLLHILLVLLPLPIPLPAALYLFWRQGTHLPIGFTMQHGFTLGKSSVLFFLCHFSLPNNSYNFICHFNCYWAVSWCFPSSYISYSFHAFPACRFSCLSLFLWWWSSQKILILYTLSFSPSFLKNHSSMAVFESATC